MTFVALSSRGNKAVLTATAAIGSTVVAICYYYYYNQYRTSSSFAKKKGPHKGGGGTSRNQKETSSDAEEEVVLGGGGGGSWDPSEFIPTHVARQIQKQARWQQKKELFAMKSPMYDNVQMLDKRGELLCTISTKKGRWYVRKGLAAWTDPEESRAIQLNFDVKERASTTKTTTTTTNNNDTEDATTAEKNGSDVYQKSEKHNICVACGDAKQYMRHYVVPYAMKKLFPPKYKSHLSHDIVILCPNCHVHCERESHKRMNFLIEQNEQLETNKDPELQFIVDPHLYHVRSCALALLRWKDKLPPDKATAYEDTVLAYLTTKNNNESSLLSLNHHLENELTASQLQLAIDVEYRIENSEYIPGPQRLLQSMEGNETKMEAFIKDWRQHFLDTAQPRYLPTGWSIDSPVTCNE